MSELLCIARLKIHHGKLDALGAPGQSSAIGFKRTSAIKLQNRPAEFPEFQIHGGILIHFGQILRGSDSMRLAPLASD
jgi:hypothetical protein